MGGSQGAQVYGSCCVWCVFFLCVDGFVGFCFMILFAEEWLRMSVGRICRGRKSKVSFRISQSKTQSLSSPDSQ